MTRIIRTSRTKLVLLLTFVVLLSGCVTAPSEPQVGQTAPTTKISSVRQQPQLHQNAEVFWGGSVIGIDNRAEETWIEIIERSLHRTGIPNLREKSTGRFIAIVPGFLDPLDYSNGRSITITGTVSGSETRKIAEANYDYPIVAVADHKLWSDAQALSTERRYSNRTHYPFYDYYRYPYRRHFRNGYGIHGYGYGGHRSRYRGRHRNSVFISGRSRF